MDNGSGTGTTVVITGAQVIDGSGAPAVAVDLLIRDGIIAAIETPGTLPVEQFPNRVDAAGLVVCPGFIDAHSHADNAPLLAEDDLTKISQGVTTEVTGNCGFSLAPIAPVRTQDTVRTLRQLFPFEYGGWHSTTELFEAMYSRGSVTNICPLVGHGALRVAVMGPTAAVAGADDVRAMGALLVEALGAGAFGVSTGLIYPPGVYSDTAELVVLASFLPSDRVYATHMRDEGSGLVDSVEEALAIGRASGCRVQISHLKSAGKANHGEVDRAMKLLDQARLDGLPVTQDVYPYDAASTMLSSCLPPWVHDGGPDATLRRLRDPAVLTTIRGQIEGTDDASWENPLGDPDGYGDVLVASTRSHRYEGMTLAQIADGLAVEPFDALVRVLTDERLEVSMVHFCMSEQDVETVLRSSFTAIGSDGIPPGTGGRPHPRLYGTFPRVLGRYVRERQVLDLSTAIHRMTGLPAEVFGVPRRGRVAVGNVADLVCFDAATVDHPGDYVNPSRRPTGIVWVMQSGHIVMDSGRWCGTRRGARLLPV